MVRQKLQQARNNGQNVSKKSEDVRLPKKTQKCGGSSKDYQLSRDPTVKAYSLPVS